MSSTSILSIGVAVVVAAIFIFFLLRKRISARITTQTPSLITSFAAFFEGNDEKALSEMRAIALADKGTPEIYLSIGFLYRKLGDYTKAAQIHEILMGNQDIDPEYKRLVATELAKDYFKADMPLKTLAVLNGEKDAENNSENLLLFARASLAVHNFDAAAAYHNRYQKFTGGGIYGFLCKCMIEKAIQSKDLTKATKAIKTALMENPNCRPARFIMAGILQKEGKHTKAMDEYKSIIKQGLVRDMNDMKSIEAAFIASGEESSLLSFLKAAALENAENPFIAMYLSEYYKRAGETEEAKSLLYMYLTRVGVKTAPAKAYAAFTGDKIMENILKHKKPFICKICKAEYSEYHDDCTVCGSFDSVLVK